MPRLSAGSPRACSGPTGPQGPSSGRGGRGCWGGRNEVCIPLELQALRPGGVLGNRKRVIRREWWSRARQEEARIRNIFAPAPSQSREAAALAARTEPFPDSRPALDVRSQPPLGTRGGGPAAPSKGESRSRWAEQGDPSLVSVDFSLAQISATSWRFLRFVRGGLSLS